MRVIAVNEYGAAPAVMEVPDPQPGPGQVLIKVEGAAINPLDRMIADGALQPIGPAQFPLVLGVDVAGTVEALGEGANRFALGEELFGQVLSAPWGSTGTYAEHVAVGEDQPLARVPQGLDPVVAAALPTAGSTALEIVESLEPLSGKTVVLVGAAGGVGSFATQFASNAGAHLVAVASADAGDRLRSYGAADVIDHTAGSVPDALRRAHPDGIDVLIDLASDAEDFAELASLVRSGGTALKTRFQFAADIEGLATRGVTGVNYELHASSEVLQRVADAVASGRIAPPPIARITLDDVANLNGGRPDGGKTVVIPGRR
jgi:NADPH:quinone reductase-like Zn-dependent oxidoreductase